MKAIIIKIPEQEQDNSAFTYLPNEWKGKKVLIIELEE